jgi:hypothetical protein
VERQGGDPALVARLRAVDFYFLNLNQVRHDFSAIIQHYVSEPQRVMAGAAEERR